MSTETPEFLAGLARTLIRIRSRGMGMMGYGQLSNRAEGMASDLCVRACVLTDTAGQRLGFANLEICFVTQAIRAEVLRRLQHETPESDWREDNLILTAQHTHSAPGGYSHYFFYNVTVPGFQPEVFEAIVSACVSALREAEAQQAPALLEYVHGAFPAEKEVAFNRSLEAYNTNPEVQKRTPYETHLAIDRQMYLLKILSPTQELRGVINWFGVHATSIGPENRRISADNKGVAARLLEQYIHQQHKHPGFVGIFAQGAAGDVSPNFHGKGRNWPKGKFEEDHENAHYNGRLQYEQALELLARPGLRLSGGLRAELVYADFARQSCDPRFTGGQSECRTAPAAHGLAFFKGTAIDGKGVSDVAAGLLSAFARRLRKSALKRAAEAPEAERQKILAKYAAQDPKEIILDCGDRSFLGLTELKDLPVPDFLEPVLAEIKRLHRTGAIQEHTWVPEVLPVQLARIGQLVLAAVPGEMTTVAAQRLRASLQQDLPTAAQVVISPYANAYQGYICTPEEYACQSYEGGHTVFGKWTLAAFQTVFARVAAALQDPSMTLDKTLRPPVFSARELALRTVQSP
jgi:neutral ceramidase